MAKGVFTTKIEPAYDDQPEVRYHFPRSLLSEVEQTVGDLIVYYEPRRPGSSGTGGRSAYFATALVERIEPDPAKAGHFYAYVSSFLEFPNSVPFRSGPHYWESALRKADGSTNRGRFGRSVRTLPSQEYEAIVREGMRAPPRLAETTAASDFQDEQAPFVREVREVVLNRKIRDQAFALLVRGAYDSTCAFTGLKLINGGGRSEIEAAHIQPVGGEHAGPDSVRNGLALSRTLHWMFDRGLMSLEDDGKILMAKRRDDDALGRVRRLLHPDGYARLPADARFKPHGRFLRYHREAVFKE